MASVLAYFFNITVLLTLILLGVNLSITTFGESMTGDASLSSGVVEDTLSGADVNAISSDIEQISSSASYSSIQQTGFNALYEQALNLGGPYQKVLDKIFSDIDPANTNDVSEQAGDMIRGIIILFQIIGLAYIPFAVWSAVFGGGSP